jgi:hypothetical protein
MKSTTIIYEKRKITIEELVNHYYSNICWFCILFINLIIIHYSNIHTNDVLCFEEYSCQKSLELIKKKLSFSSNIIYIGLLANIFAIITKKYICRYICNLDILHFLLYILPSLFDYSILYHVFFNNQITEEKINSRIFNIVMVYELYEITLCGLFLMLGIICVVNFFEIITWHYNTKIKNITFEYFEPKFIDLEKNETSKKIT